MIKISNIFLKTIIFSFLISFKTFSAEAIDPIKVDWSFKGLTGKFDRSSLQRSFQVYKEVCSSCHSMKYLSYRNLGEPGGPEFSEKEVKAIAASFEVTDGPDSQGEMFLRPAAERIKEIMQTAITLEVPNKVDYESGPNWGTIK